MPRVAVAVSICVTDDVARAREHIDTILAGYARVPEYHAMLQREGTDQPSGVAVVGPEAVVTQRLAELEGLGVTDLVASVKAPSAEEWARTRTFISSYACQRD